MKTPVRVLTPLLVSAVVAHTALALPASPITARSTSQNEPAPANVAVVGPTVDKNGMPHEGQIITSGSTQPEKPPKTTSLPPKNGAKGPKNPKSKSATQQQQARTGGASAPAPADVIVQGPTVDANGTPHEGQIVTSGNAQPEQSPQTTLLPPKDDAKGPTELKAKDAEQLQQEQEQEPQQQQLQPRNGGTSAPAPANVVLHGPTVDPDGTTHGSILSTSGTAEPGKRPQVSIVALKNKALHRPGPPSKQRAQDAAPAPASAKGKGPVVDAKGTSHKGQNSASGKSQLGQSAKTSAASLKNKTSQHSGKSSKEPREDSSASPASILLKGPTVDADGTPHEGQIATSGTAHPGQPLNASVVAPQDNATGPSPLASSV